MFVTVLRTLLPAVIVIMLLVVAVILTRKFVRTRDIGLIWLGVAVVVWPLVMRLLERREMILVDRLVHQRPVGFYPFSLVEHGQDTVGGLVILLSFIAAVCWGLSIVSSGALSV